MKKIYMMLALLLGFFATSEAQSYSIVTSTGTDADYDYATSGSDILTVTSADVLSSWQTLPFSFNFFGAPVSGYFASDNGYITFDNSASTSYAANTLIPAVGGPNQAIYAFWDDVNVAAGSGSTDRVTSWTYGTTPNRVHVVQWYSVTPASATGFLYCAIRIYECGTFDVINSFGNATGMSATIGCENAAGSAAAVVSGSPNLSYPSVGSAQTDDVVYTFLDSGINYDAAVTSIGFSNAVTVGNNTVTGTIQNLGAATITSFDLNYTVNGGAAVTDNITGVSIAAGATYNFSHGTVWNVATGGQTLNLCVYATNLNSNTDQRSCNDEMCASLFSNNGTSGTKKVLIEEFTGAWCGWCPDGAVVLESILDNNPGNAFGVSVHDGDQMEFSDGIRTGFGVSAYPNGMVDRYVFAGEADEPHSRGAWVANTATRLAAYTPVDVSISANGWNSSTREISVTAKADFVDYAAGDLRFVMYITEDSVVGSGTGYDQVNYLDATAGHPYFGAGDPIVGFIHRHVLRDLPGGAMGNSGVIPASVSPSSSYSESFSYILPASYDETRIELIAAVAYNSNSVGERFVANSYGEKLNLVLIGVDEEIVSNSMTVYPNPNAGQSVVKLSLDHSSDVSVKVFDTFGKMVADVANRNLPSGDSMIDLNLSSLANGFYFVKVYTDAGTLTQKVSVIK